MSFKSITAKCNGGNQITIEHGDKLPTVRVGDVLSFVWDVEPGSVLQVWINNGQLKNRNVCTDNQGPVYAADWKVDVAAGVFNVIFEQRFKGETIARVEVKLPVEAAENATPGTPPPSKPDPLPTIEWGATANDADDQAAVLAGIKLLKAEGGKWLRIWHSSFGAFSKGTVAIIKAASGAGLSVVLCVQPKDGDREEFGTPDFAGFVKKNEAVLRLVEFVEAGNELNLVKYRPDDFGGDKEWHVAYVERFLKPLAEALAPIKVKVLCTSVTNSEKAQDYATQAAALAAAGAAKYCHGLALHVYTYADGKANVFTVAQLPGVLREYSRVLGDLPIHLTEAGLHKSLGDDETYRETLPLYIAAIRRAGVVRSMQHYRLTPSKNPGNNQAGRPLVDNDGKPLPLLGLVKVAAV